MPRKLTYEEVKSYIESFIGHILLSTEYKSSITKLKIQCPEGHIFWMTIANFKQGQRCPECKKKNNAKRCRLTYEEVKSYIESFIGHILLSTEYKNSHTKLKIRCPEGHIFWMSYSNFQQGHGCAECYKNNHGNNLKLDYKEVKKYIESFGYTLLSTKYKNANTKLKMRCPEGHVFWLTYGHFRNGVRCMSCYKKSRFIPNQEIIDKLSFCENIRETEDKQIEVRCTYCRGWHIPERWKLLYRIKHIEGKLDHEYRLYCSQQCKDECSIYNQNWYPKNFTLNKDDLYTSAEYNLWRQTVLEREEYMCQYCEKEANTAHHEHPQKTHPHMALDPDNGIACCMSCHYEYGHKTGTECSTGMLASKVC